MAVSKLPCVLALTQLNLNNDHISVLAGGGEKYGERNTQNSQQPTITNNVMALMFLPFTKTSGLASKYRESEGSLGALCGYKLKFVEEAGRKIIDNQSTSNPCRGEDCELHRCVPFDTKEKHWTR